MPRPCGLPTHLPFLDVLTLHCLKGRIANSLELQTPSKDLYIYDIMLKLQPYMDERAVAAALAQRDLLEVPVAEGRQPVAHGKQS